MTPRARARYFLALALGFMLAFSLMAFTRGDAGIDGATNTYRQSIGLAPLVTSTTLNDLAAQRAVEIAQPDGWHHEFWWWDASGCAWVGENLAQTPQSGDLAQHFVDMWIASLGHQVNLAGDWHQMGSATVFINGTTWAVQLFGKDCGGSSAPVPAPVPAIAPPAPYIPTAEQPAVDLPNTSMEKP